MRKLRSGNEATQKWITTGLRMGSHMKIFIIIAFLLMGCSANRNTTLSYSSDFKLTLPNSYFTGATVFYSDELSVKTDKGILFSGKIISNKSESIPESLDIRDYPKYILKIKPLSDEGGAYSKIFNNSSSEIDYVYGLENTLITNKGDFIIYSLCKDNKCLAYIVKNIFKDHILSVNGVGLNSAEFLNLINRAIYVKP